MLGAQMLSTSHQFVGIQNHSDERRKVDGLLQFVAGELWVQDRVGSLNRDHKLTLLSIWVTR